MRAFLALFVAGVVSTVSASIAPYALYPRDFGGYPDCALGCLSNITSSKCQAAEVSCLCEDTTFVSEQTACFQSSCNGTDLQAADTTARDTCAAAGVTLTSSAAASTGTSAAPSSKKNDAGSSTTISIIGGAAALGLAVLAL